MTKKCLILGLVGVIILGSCFESRAQGKEEFLFEETPVVFAATKYEQPVKEAPAAVTIITADQIKRYGYRTLSDVLRGVTGLYVTYDRTYEYLGVRGYQVPGDYSSRILVLVDGHTTNDGVYGSGPVGRELGIDMNMVRRIEVIKGPGSALYGTSALFCVINVVTKDGKEADGLRISGGLGSYGSKEGSASYSKRIADDWRLFISGSWTEAEGQDLYFSEFDDPETNNGVFEDGDWETVYNFFAKLAYRDLTLEGGLNSRDKGIPTAAWETIFNDNRSQAIDGGRFVELKYTPHLDETKELMGRIYHRHYFYDGDYISWYEDEFGEEYKEDFIDFTRNNWIGSEIQFNWKVTEENRLTFGGEYQNHYQIHQKGYDKGLLGPDYYYEYLNDKRKLQIWSFYLQNIYRLRTNWSFILGGRFDHYSTFGSTLNPRVGTVYNPWEESSLKLLYGKAFRAPTTYELYYHDGYMTMKPSPSLDPEELRTYEAVFEQGIGKNVEGSISVYRTNLSNLVYQAESQQLSVSTGEALLELVNVGNAEATGLELSLKGEWNGLEGRIGYNYQVAKDEATNQKLANSPENSGNLGISVPLLQKKFYLTGEVHYVGKRLTLSETKQWVDPYLRTDVTIFSNRILNNLEITAKINNVFNESYSDPVSNEFRQTEIRQDDRNFWLKIGYTL